MSTRVWVISDTHFGHANMLTFVRSDGTPVRPGFATVQDIDAHMIERWNAVVRPQDHVYHLGDVALAIPSQAAAFIIKSLNGRKRLVRGNHDRYSTNQYVRMGFEEIHGLRMLGDVWLTHAPIHPESMGKCLGNIHGHIHAKPSPAGPYFNVSVEVVNYTPVDVDEIRAHFRATR